MLILTLFDPIKKSIEYGFIGLWTIIDGVVYRLLSMFFKLFYALADGKLLDNSIYRAIATRVYLFIGIIALFTLSIALLKALVNPDEINKGVIKSFKSLITSVILVILIPTIFTYAFSFQSAIIDDNIIGKIFELDLNKFKETGESEITSSKDSMNNVCTFKKGEVKTVTVKSHSGSKNPNIEITSNECKGNYITMTVLEAFFTPEKEEELVNKHGTTWVDAKKYMIYTGNFNYLSTFAKNAYSEAEDNSVSYLFIVSTVAAGFLIYLLLSFSIDLGVRSAKLAFYQLIAPIPVLMKIIPGKEGQFDKWMKATISTFLEVFVRLIVIEFVIFMSSNLFEIIDSMSKFSEVGLIGKAVLVLGLFAFAKQAPKLLADALGFDAGNLKLGIKGKLTDIPIAGKAFGKTYDTANKFKGAATGALGAGYSSAINGGSFGAGAKYGLASGWKSGGSQFGAQRQGIYDKMGYKGKAGWFGGQAIMDKKLDDYQNKYTDYYKDNILAKKIYNSENSSKFKSIYEDEIDKLKTANGYSNLVSTYNSLNANRSAEIAKIEEDRNTAQIQFEQQRAKNMREYKSKIEELENNARKMTPGTVDFINTMGEVQKYKQAYDKAKSSKFDRSSFDARINDIDKAIEKARKDLDYFNDNNAVKYKKYDASLGKLVDATMSKAESDALENARSVMGNLDPTYNNDIKVYKARLSENEIRKYKNSLEGQQAIAAMTEAFKNANKSAGSSNSKDNKK